MRTLALRAPTAPTDAAAGPRTALADVVAWWSLVPLGAGLVASLWAGSLLIGRVDGLATPAYDLAFFQQVLWNVGTSGSWTSSFDEGSFLGLHFSPLLVVPALLERLTGFDVRLLSLLHALGIGALIPASFLFLQSMLRPSRLAVPVACALAIAIPIWGVGQDLVRADFRPELYGVLFALLAGWAGLTGRILAMWLLAAAGLLSREDISYAVFAVGAVVSLHGHGRARRQGVAISIVAVVWAAVVFGLLMPGLRGGVRVDTDRYYAWLGGGASALLAPLTMGDRVVAALTRPGPWFVVAGMVLSLAGLPLLRARWLLLVVPPLAASLLSAHLPQANLTLHYPLLLLVPLLVAGGMGARWALALLARRRRWWPLGRLSHAPAAGVVVGFLALPAVAGAWVQGSLPPFDRNDPAFAARPAAVERLRVIGQAVPPEALLIADEGLVAPLAGRARIGRLNTIGSVPADAFVIIDRNAWTPGPRSAERRARTLLRVTTTRPLWAEDGRFVVYGPQSRGVPE
jgi:hypothetical protein